MALYFWMIIGSQDIPWLCQPHQTLAKFLPHMHCQRITKWKIILFGLEKPTT